MNTRETINAVPGEAKADQDAVMEHFLTGKYLDSAICNRVRSRAEQITEELRQKHGEMDIAVDLVRESRDEA